MQFCVKSQMIGIKRDSVVSGFSMLCLSLYTEEDRERGRERKEEKDGVILVLHQMTKKFM